MDRHRDINYATVLENAGMENEWARNVLGFGLDMLLDPLNVFLFPKVATAAGRFATRVGREASRVPGVTPAVTTVQRPLASLFSPRLGLGQQGETYWHVRQMARKGDFGPDGIKAADTLIKYDRRYKNYRRNSDWLAVNEAVEGLRGQRFRDLVAGKGLAAQPEFVGQAWRARQGFKQDPGTSAYDVLKYEELELGNKVMPVSKQARDELATRPAEEVVWVTRTREEALRYGEDVEAISLPRGARMLEDLGEEGALVYTGPVTGKGGLDEATAKVQADEFIDAIRTNADLNRELSQQLRNQRGLDWESVAARAEEIGVDVANLPGASSLVRFLRAQFADKQSANHFSPDPVELGKLAKMRQTMGTTLDSGFYMGSYFGDIELMKKALVSSESLQKRALGFAQPRKKLSNRFVETQLENNVLLGISHDIATTRINFYSHQLISDELLSKVGRKVTLTDEQFKARVSEAGGRGLDLGAMRALHERGVAIDDIAERLAGDRKITIGGKAQFAARQIPDVPGRAAHIAMPDDKLIRQILENDEIPGVVKRYDPNPRHLYLEETELRDLVDAGIMNLPETKRTAYLLPEELAQSFEKYSEPLKMVSWLRALDTLNGFWKPLVTVMPWNVSFFTRNEAGLAEMMALSGMRFDEMALYGTRAARYMKEGLADGIADVPIKLKPEGVARWAERGETAPTNYNRVELYQEWAENGGVMVGQREVAPIDPFTGKKHTWLERKRAWFTGQKLSTGLQKAETMRQLIKEYGDDMWTKHRFNPVAWGTTMNEGLDNHARIAVMLWRMDKGDTPAEAARVAAKYIGNYTELGRFTSEIAPVVPFARWIRFSTPLQVEGLVRRPYVGAKVGLARGDGADQERLKAEVETLPDWMLEAHHIMLGKDPDGRHRVLTGLGLPIEDINRLFALNPANTFQNAMKDITPFLRAPLERLIDYSFFTGEPISNKEKPWNFYNRAWGWTSRVPVLRNWLELEQLESADGSLFYRVNNPLAMFVFASIVSRAGFEADRVGRIFEERDGLQFVNFLTGVKFRRIFPEAPSKIDMVEVLNKNPSLRALWDEYQKIALYPQFKDPALSRQASRAINKIHAWKRVMSSMGGRKVTKREAAEAYAEIDSEGAGLATMVWDRGWKQEGRKQRAEYRSANPALTALSAELAPEEYQIIMDRYVR